MNLFDSLVQEALKNQPNLAVLKTVVEKELLHHDILRILSQNNLLANLTFIGGTCLRACYGGVRLSEDLDFSGGENFSRASLSELKSNVIDGLQKKYGLKVDVSEPIKDIKNVDTWKIKIETRPKQKDFPAQRINIDISSVKSYEKKPMLLINPYGVDMGTQGLIINAESREEIYVDKLLAFALRPNRLKHRDLWDILWLHQQGIKPNLNLVPKKLAERNLKSKAFISLFDERQQLLIDDKKLAAEFKQEMQRFLAVGQLQQLNQAELWNFLGFLMADWGRQLKQSSDRS